MKSTVVLYVPWKVKVMIEQHQALFIMPDMDCLILTIIMCGGIHKGTEAQED